MKLEELRKKYKLIDLFVELCEIPSPSLKEYSLSEKILSIFEKNGIFARYDEYKNVIATIPATGKFAGKDIQPVLLSAHMDVVGGMEHVNTRISSDGKYIETDKTRTLGADNKAGIAVIIDTAIDIANPKNQIEHGAIEITFTRDEERGMTGIRNLDTSELKSKYVIVADNDKLGKLDCEGAGFTNVYIKVSGGKGGHSGLNIHEKDRISAIKVLSELDNLIPQGVYKFDPNKGVITSINAGVCSGGTINTTISEVLSEIYELGKNNLPIPEKYSTASIMNTLSKLSALNVITTESESAYSVRSSEPDNENELISIILKAVNELNTKYDGKIKVSAEINRHMAPFVKNADDSFVNLIVSTGNKFNLNCVPASFHAGAETHIFSAEKKNFYGSTFIPVLIGLANIENMHSSDEKIDWESLLIGRKWLEEIILRSTAI